jgi:hypothetical protein
VAEWRVAKDMKSYSFKNKDTPKLPNLQQKCIQEEVIYIGGEMSTTQIHVKHDLNLGFQTLLMSNSTL